jgi:hypothetical protein
MPGTRSVTDLAVLIERAGQAALDSQKEGVFKAAKMIKDSIEGERSKALKGSDHFSRMTKKKQRSGTFKGIRPETHKLRIWFDMKGTYNPTALLVARGPWGLIEYGSPPHEITAALGAIQYKKGKRARSYALQQRSLDIAYGATGLFAGTKPLRLPYGSPRYRVRNHPGFKGRQPFKKGLEAKKDEAARVATALVQSRVVDVWRMGRETTITVRGDKRTFGQGLVG